MGDAARLQSGIAACGLGHSRVVLVPWWLGAVRGASDAEHTLAVCTTPVSAAAAAHGMARMGTQLGDASDGVIHRLVIVYFMASRLGYAYVLHV